MSAMPDPAADAPPFSVVLLDANIGTYALARAFHERYGVTSTVVTRVGTGAVSGSSIIDLVELGLQSTRQDVLETLLRIGRERQGGPPTLLLGNSDFTAAFLSTNREALAPYYLSPILPLDTLGRISDKGHFAELSESLGIATPATVVVDVAAEGEDAAVTRLPFSYPVVVKAASTAAYEELSFPGKRKVYVLSTPDEVAELVRTLRGVGYRNRLVVQELVGGDDQHMRSITAYRDQFGTVTLLASARVIVEEHAPLTLGNPAAMVTTAYEDAWEQAERFLHAVDYHGFANFDLKEDPADGTLKFLEVNPRIGRNNYYVTAAGANVSQFVVADLVQGLALEPQRVREQVLYSVIPYPLLTRYATDPELRSQVRSLRRGMVHPLSYRGDSWRRKGYLWTSKANHVRKFARYYPRPTGTGF